MSIERLIILGSGPAGLSAGIYAARAGLKPLILEGIEPGGQLLQTKHVANYPGFPETVPGETIINAMRTQAEKAGVRFLIDHVESVDFNGSTKKLFTMMGSTLEAQCVIIATGSGVTKTNLPGESKYWGHGISACVTCDAAFYAGKRVILVGEGAQAQGAKRYLERCGSEIAGIFAPGEMQSFEGDGTRLNGVILRQSSQYVPCDGLFLVTSRSPRTKFLGDALELDEKGHIVTSGAVTSVDGVFAAGDCAEPLFKQAVIAAADGARAAMLAVQYGV